MYHDIVFWRVVQPWHLVWEDWIASRLFGWIADNLRKHEECIEEFKALWAPS